MNKNVLLIVIDSLAYGEYVTQSKQGAIPNMTAFGQQAASFSEAMSTASTTSVCFASLMTGQYPLHHGVRALNGFRLSEDVTTLAEVFQQNGYHTIASVTGPLSPLLELNRGFDDYRYRGHSDNLYGPLMDEVLGILAEPREQPFFMLLHLWETHSPYWLPELENRQTTMDKLYKRGRYVKSIRSLDASLGKVFDAVDHGQTITVLTADHGEIIGSLPERTRARRQHRRGVSPLSAEYVHLAHGSHVYQTQLHVPLFIRAEGMLQPQTIDKIVRQVDLAPTVASLAGLDWSTQADGQRLFDADNRFQAPPQEIYLEAAGETHKNRENWLVGLRTPKWKYAVAPYFLNEKAYLFNLETDPYEKKNLIGKYPDVEATLRARLEEIMGASLQTLSFPETVMSAAESDALDQRLRALGYL